MSLLPIQIDRAEHPLDIVERLASLRHWIFDRADADEMSISVEGAWCEYQIAFTWLDEVEALHVACAFDLKVVDRRRQDILELVARINEQLWIGHFDIWSNGNVVMFRHGVPLAGGAELTQPQCETLLKAAVEACERYYQAFQFVMWAGKSAQEALNCVLFETEGEA